MTIARKQAGPADHPRLASTSLPAKVAGLSAAELENHPDTVQSPRSGAESPGESAGTAADDLNRGRSRRATVLWMCGLGAALLAVIIAATGLGPVLVPPMTVARIISHHVLGLPAAPEWSAAQEAIVWRVRVPRVLLGALVGATLAVAGAVLQTVVRNVLADPHLIGVTSGASTGAAVSLLFGVGAGGMLTASAFLGGLAATALVFVIARLNGRLTALRLLLGGVTIGYLFSAATSFLIFASDSPEGARAVLFWLLGSLGSAAWPAVASTALVSLGCLVVLFLLATRLDALAVGDDTARTLGVDPMRLRALTLALVALAVGAAVAVAGAIGFVGLIVPHVARLAVGAAHRRLLPASALLGAIFLVAADVLARMAFAPRELPLGIVTAVVGAPLLLLLIRRYRTAEIS
ncbi:FecCD family ABC transporter permease [Nocardia huaxiensis]|uniref:FecCD family ABC transporter permease n=1 Tax=Nocardia huaxiensis TaxID=2755382 RepID=UPI001E57A941|nr:iron ABC transporter permease [Nocardia huaxiensis]UFS98693.1 iron ABC transporter permease [Nocardia huaxiensis]